MRLLLLSRSMDALPAFLGDACGTGRALRIGYVSDAQAAFADAPFVVAERDGVRALGHEVVDLRVRDLDGERATRVLDALDVVYVASGSTFALLEALRAGGAGEVLVERVRAGLPYVGASAGSIVAGPSIEPASLMDDPADGPTLTDHLGLALVDRVAIPHADGQLPPYPPELIARTVETYGDAHPLLLLRDDQALLVDDDGARVIAS